jgi:hypothetical protein
MALLQQLLEVENKEKIQQNIGELIQNKLPKESWQETELELL